MPIDLHLAWWAAAAGLGLAAGVLSAGLVARWPGGGPALGAPPRGAEALAIAGVSAAAAAAPLALAGPRWDAVAAGVLLVALVPVVVIDVRHRLIPDAVVLPAAVVALAAAVAGDPRRWWEPCAASLGAAAFLLVPAIVRPEAMGLGDVKLALLIGAALGASVVPALAAAFAAAAAAGAALLVRHGAEARHMGIPFGPYLAGGAVAGLVWGPAALDWCAGRLA
jgi:leader peptidase (prepilin peptidase) / N-methyltransferase